MANKRSFLRSRAGHEDFAEISWTRRAIEFAEGARHTPGVSRDQIFKREGEVEDAVRAEVTRLIEAGFVEYTGDAALRLDPAEHAVQAAESSLEKICAVPVFTRGDPEPVGSRRGGLPWLAVGEPWPSCDFCARLLRFVLQVALEDVAQVPSPLPREGLLQFFACDSKCYFSEGWQAFSRTIRVRVLEATQGRVATLPESIADDADFLLADEIVERWEFVSDLPGPDELASLVGVDIDPALEGWRVLKEKGLTNRWQKIGGWPSWAQGEESVACRKCGTSMSYAMQLESTLRELDVLFGNCVYIMCCSSCGEMTAVQQR